MTIQVSQLAMEYMMHPKHILQSVKDELVRELPDTFNQATMKIRQYSQRNDWWKSKANRMMVLGSLDIYELILNIIAKTVIHCDKPMPLTSFLGMCNIPELDKIQSFQTVGEIIKLLEEYELFHLSKNSQGSYMIESLLEFDGELGRRLRLFCYLPPMTQKPKELTHNKSSGYISIKSDSLILGGSVNHHDGNIGLDVLNTLNSNEYELDLEFINTHVKQWHRQELSTDELTELDLNEQKQYQQDADNWEVYQEQFNVLKDMLIHKTIHFTHKVDKRGRVYAQGYHFNTQGSSFEKACINLKTKETVTGDL